MRLTQEQLDETVMKVPAYCRKRVKAMATELLELRAFRDAVLAWEATIGVAAGLPKERRVATEAIAAERARMQGGKP